MKDKINTEDYLWWTEFRDVLKDRLTHIEYKMVCEIHSRSFNLPLIYVSKCGSCGKVQKLIDDINALYLEKL